MIPLQTAPSDDQPEILMLKPSEVLVDPEVQRTFDPRHAQNLSKGYESALFGMGHVSVRDDGYYVMDAQHRSAAAILAGKGDIPVPFRAWRGLTKADEAKLFGDLNAKKKAPNAIDSFRISVAAGNPVACEIVRILKAFGLTYGFAYQDGAVSAVKTLIQVYNGHVGQKASGQTKQFEALPQSQLLTRTLTIITDAWGRDRGGLDGIMIKGVAALLVKHGAKVDSKRLSGVLKKNSDPARAIGQIKSLQNISKISATVAAVEYLEGVYNRGLTEAKKLVR